MFGSLGGAEILMVLVLALLLFGPRKLPQIGRTMGKAMSEFRKATHDLRSNLEQEVHAEEVKEVRAGIESVREEISHTVQQVDPRRVLDEAVRADETHDGDTEKS